MKYAAKLDYEIDLRPLTGASTALLRDYNKLQHYCKGMPGDYVLQAKEGWAAKNKSVSNADVFIDQLPSELLAQERPYVIILELPAFETDNPVLPAHRDYNKTCGINLYLEANGEKTTFYNWNRQTRQCDYVEEFCASTGELWIMNTDVPHSVTLVSKKARSMLSFCFTKMKYEQVLAHFQQ